MHRWVGSNGNVAPHGGAPHRRYDLLDPGAPARTLIDGFRRKAAGVSAIRAQGRRDPLFQYEVVCGARRHWTVTWLREHNYPEFPVSSSRCGP